MPTDPNPAAMTPPPEAEAARDRAPLAQLIASVGGGVLGIALFVVGAVLAATRGVFSPWALACMGASLAIYVLLLLWDRRLEEESATLRRTLYGFNVFLMCGLLLVVLGIVNVLTFKYGRDPVDMTRSGYFTLAPQTISLLESLDAPVKVTVIFPEQSRTLLGEDRQYVQARYALEDMLDLYQKHTNRLEVEYIDPYRDPTLAEGLAQKYADLGTPPVVLVEYGEGDRPDHEVVRYTDLVEGGEFSEARVQVNLKAEDALTSALTRLTQGTKSAKIYFTTGRGELDPGDTTQSSTRGIGELNQRLEELGIETGAFDPDTQPEVPDDADLVIVAGPQQPFSAASLSPLSDYMNRGGKMIVLADYVFNPVTRSSVDLGLDGFLRQYKVQLGNEQVYELLVNPFTQTARPDPRPIAAPTDADLQLVKSLSGRPVQFFEARSVSPVPETPGATPAQGNNHEAISILQGGVVLPEEGDRIDLREARENPVSLAVAIVERKQPATPPMPGHPPVSRPGNTEPRMVVFGDADFVANNQLLDPRSGGAAYSAMLGSINWLRGRMELLGIPPKSRERLVLNASPEEQRSMVWKPTALILGLLLISGITVWMVRHRA